MKIGDRVEVLDTDGFGEEGAWLPGIVYQILGSNRYRISCDCGGMLDAKKGQWRVSSKRLGRDVVAVETPVQIRTSAPKTRELGPAPKRLAKKQKEDAGESHAVRETVGGARASGKRP